MNEIKQGIWMLMTIVEKGSGKQLLEYYTQNGVPSHYRCKGRGTASSELLDVLGVGTSERDILISMGARTDVNKLMIKIHEEDLSDFAPGKGIIFSMPLTGLNQIVTQAILSRSSGGAAEGGEHLDNAEHSLILIIVNQGHTEDVMNTARGAGARGGTVIRSRWAGSEEVENFYGLSFQEEKEILTIVVQKENRDTIMEMINKQHGIKTEAGAVICSLGIDSITRVG